MAGHLWLSAFWIFMTLCNGDFLHQLCCSLKISLSLFLSPEWGYLQSKIQIFLFLLQYFTQSFQHKYFTSHSFVSHSKWKLFVIFASKQRFWSKILIILLWMLILTAWLSWCALFTTTQDPTKKSVSSTVTRISHTFSAVWLYSKILPAKAVLFSAHYLPWNPWLSFIDPGLLFQPCQEQGLHLFGVLLAVEEAGLKSCS